MRPKYVLFQQHPPVGWFSMQQRWHMSNRIGIALTAFSAAVLLLSSSPTTLTAQDKGKAPKWVYAHDLRVRPGGEKDINAKTPKIGVEFFIDETNNAEIALSQVGSIAVTPSGEIGKDTKAEWLTAHDMRVRKAGEANFTQMTKQFGVEVFKDQGSKLLLYISESSSVAFAPMPAMVTGDKGPKWHHALEPKVRGPEQETFDSANKFGVEVFKDENTGGLVYITETGSIATAAAPAAAPEKGKVASPKPLYGLVLRVRGASEPDFSEKTKKIGVEVFEDPNSNVYFFLSASGAIATAPKLPALTGTRGVTWKGAMNLKARKGGDKGFDKASKFGIEVFQDNQTGYLVYICETGSIAVLPAK